MEKLAVDLIHLIEDLINCLQKSIDNFIILISENSYEMIQIIMWGICFLIVNRMFVSKLRDFKFYLESDKILFFTVIGTMFVVQIIAVYFIYMLYIEII